MTIQFCEQQIYKTFDPTWMKVTPGPLLTCQFSSYYLILKYWSKTAVATSYWGMVLLSAVLNFSQLVYLIIVSIQFQYQYLMHVVSFHHFTLTVNIHCVTNHLFHINIVKYVSICAFVILNRYLMSLCVLV